MPLEVQFNLGGEFKDVKVVDVPKPSIQSDNQVLIKFLLNPVNPSDVYSVLGAYQGFQPESYPAVPGLEGVAVVEEVGKSVSSVKVGQRVVIIIGDIRGGPTKIGTWKDYALYDEENIFPVPDNVSDEAAAQAIVNPVTAYALLDKLNVPQGDYVLQTAAGSVLGRIFIQFAKRRGIKTINLVRRKELVDELKAIGADEVLNTEDGTDVVEEIKRITNGKLAYGAIDAVGGDLGLKISQGVRDDGHIFLYGALGGFTVQASTIDLLFRNVNYTGFWLSKYFKDSGKDKVLETIGKVFELLGDQVEPFAGTKYPLEKVSEAIEESLKPGRGGKVLLTHA
ncbi:GroES-like protein [Conidiobolus coronatus NRRL 28638]|uniref:GroES-like protein n=1 Tax=Conidiobolus coronatus (strain ATCC 28846 / CBS 209.66 / NRRL 28638) TaxID=796925 RepID=A0A137P985_CONC2|nr:GroES-like protein [Conidiobolus coronatus NRRL 28638]|eukprot:KXN71471.1 GroES-like protein [Conidiobolus coronatus NRRL 28638]